MTDCMNADMRDSLPDLIHGRLSQLDRATLTAHVEGCPACVEELGLLREIRATSPLAPSVDVARIVAALPQAHGAGPRLLIGSYDAAHVTPGPARVTVSQSSRFAPRLTWQIAATLLVVVGGAAVALTGGDDTTPTATDRGVTATQLHGTGSATAAASGLSPAGALGASASPAQGSVALAAAEPVGRAASARGSGPVALTLAGGINGLSDAHIEQLLTEMDGMDDIPSSDPESALSGLENLEEEG